MAEATIDDFKKLEIRVGEIKSAQPIEGSDNLLLLKIDIGEERQIVSGIKKSYKPEDLVGKTVVVIANLKPAKIRGIESQGMILAAPTEEGSWAILTTEKEVQSGAKVS